MSSSTMSPFARRSSSKYSEHSQINFAPNDDNSKYLHSIPSYYRYRPPIRAPSIESLAEQEIPSGSLTDDWDMSPFISQHYDEKEFALKEEKLYSATFPSHIHRFLLPSGRDSVTDSLLDFGEELSDLSRRSSSATRHTALLPEAPSREGFRWSDDTPAALLRKKFSESSSLTVTPERAFPAKRSAIPSQFDQLSIELSVLRTPSHSRVPSLNLSSTTCSPESIKSSESWSLSQREITTVKPFLEFLSMPTTQEKLLQARESDVDKFHHRYRMMPEPLACPRVRPPSPIHRPIPPLSPSWTRNNELQVGGPLTGLTNPYLSSSMTYQTPREAPQTPITDNYRSHFDWSDEEDLENHGLKYKLKNAATKSFTDLRQVAGRRRADSNRTRSPTDPAIPLADVKPLHHKAKTTVEPLRVRTASPSRRFFRRSHGSSSSNSDNASKHHFGGSATSPVPNPLFSSLSSSSSTPYGEILTPVATAIKRRLSSSKGKSKMPPSKLKKQCSVRRCHSRQSFDRRHPPPATIPGDDENDYFYYSQPYPYHLPLDHVAVVDDDQGRRVERVKKAVVASGKTTLTREKKKKKKQGKEKRTKGAPPGQAGGGKKKISLRRRLRVWVLTKLRVRC